MPVGIHENIENLKVNIFLGNSIFGNRTITQTLHFSFSLPVPPHGYQAAAVQNRQYDSNPRYSFAPSVQSSPPNQTRTIR